MYEDSSLRRQIKVQFAGLLALDADRQQSWTKCKDSEASQQRCLRAFRRLGPTHPVHECAQRDKNPFLQKIAISFSRVNAATRLFQLGGCFGDRDRCFATEVASTSSTKRFCESAEVHPTSSSLSHLVSPRRVVCLMAARRVVRSLLGLRW